MPITPPVQEQSSNTTLWLLIFGMISNVLVEELWFRLFLNFKNRWLFSMGLFAFLYLTFNLLFLGVWQFSFVLDYKIFFHLAILLFSLIFVVPSIFSLAKLFLTKHYFYFFYFVCLTFGLSHFWNGGNLNYQIVSVISPLVGSLFLGFIRNKYNIQSYVIFHILYNLIKI